MEISSTDDGQMHLLRGTRSRTERLEIRTACGPVKECACRAVRQIYGYKTDGLGIKTPRLHTSSHLSPRWRQGPQGNTITVFQVGGHGMECVEVFYVHSVLHGCIRPIYT